MLSLFAKACPTFVIPARLLCPWDSPGKKWVAISFSGGSSQPRIQTLVSCIGRWIPYPWAVELLLILAQVVPDVTFRKPPVVHLLVRSPLICRLPEVTVSPPRAVPSLHCLKRNIFTLLKCFNFRLSVQLTLENVSAAPFCMVLKTAKLPWLQTQNVCLEGTSQAPGVLFFCRGSDTNNVSTCNFPRVTNLLGFQWIRVILSIHTTSFLVSLSSHVWVEVGIVF